MNLDKTPVEPPTNFGRHFETHPCGPGVVRRTYTDGCSFFGPVGDLNRTHASGELFIDVDTSAGFSHKSQGKLSFFVSVQFAQQTFYYEP